MKNVFSFMALLCAFMSHAQVQVFVTLGKNNSCEGLGICRMELQQPPGTAALPCQVNVLKSGKIRLAIPKKSLQDADYLKHFATGFFYLDEDLPLSTELCSRLNISSATLRKGRHPLFDEGELIYFIL